MTLAIGGVWRQWTILAEPETIAFALDGVRYDVLVKGFRHRAPEPAAGAVTRTFTGRAVSDAVGVVQAWQLALVELGTGEDLTPDAYATLRTAIRAGRRLSVSGRRLAAGGVIVVTATLQEGVYVHAGADVLVAPVLTVERVAPLYPAAA